MTNQFQCPVCKNYIEINSKNLVGDNVIYCKNCYTYFNYKTNSYVSTINKVVNRGSHKI